MERRDNSNSRSRESLAPISFKFKRVLQPQDAEFTDKRVSSVKGIDGAITIWSDEEILKRFEEEKKRQEWFLQDYWREKGAPVEQIEFSAGDKNITLFNFNDETSFTEERTHTLVDAMKDVDAHFPVVLSQLRWILIDDNLETSLYGDTEKFPLNGQAMAKINAFRFLKRGIRTDIPHRIGKVNNLKGTFVHETAHLIENSFKQEWKERFKWERVDNDSEDWELRMPPEGSRKMYYHRLTGKMAPQYEYALEPELSVTEYATISMSEDIAESITAFVYDPDLLRRVCEEKFIIVSGHDADKAPVDIQAQRVMTENIKMPEMTQDPIHYYIKEPEDNN